jgi:hypothetical protein
MEELLLLRELIEQKAYEQALAVVDDLEEMSREDKYARIYSYAVILLVHLIKQEAEQRTTRPWDFWIFNSVKDIKRTNQRRKSGGDYADEEKLIEILEDAFDTALKKSALEAFGGIYTDEQLIEKIHQVTIKEKALSLIKG